MGVTVIYIDMVFLLNLTANYLLLLAGGRMSGAVLRRGRMGLAAALGALYACLVFLPGLGWLSAWPCRAGAGVLMVVTAYGGGRQLLRSSVMFFGASAGLAGLVLGAELLGSGPLTTANGVLYSRFDLRLLLVLFVLCYFILSLFFRRVGRHGGGEPVRAALPVEADPSRPVDSVKRLSAMGVKGARLLPFRSVGTELGLLLAVRSDGVTADGAELGPLLIALSPGPVSDGGGYQSLIGGI